MKTTLRKKLTSSPPKLLVGGYIFIILLGTWLLHEPFSLEQGETLSWIDSFFTAASATSITGLSVVETATTFSVKGEVILLCLIQLGGLGFMTFATFLMIMLGKNIGIQERVLLKESLNQTNLEGILLLAKRVIIFALSAEFIGFLIMSIRLHTFLPWKEALYYGLFHSVSFFNNSGFDLASAFSDSPHGTMFLHDPWVQLTTIFLVVVGGLGFVVIGDCLEKRSWKNFSLHSKVVLSTTLCLTIIGTLAISLVEWSRIGTMGEGSWIDKLLTSFFYATMPRTAGISLFDIGNFHSATLLIILVLMVIGAAPGSTGGGIKVTTFSILMAMVWNLLKGRNEVVMFKKTLDKDAVYKAVSVVVLSFVSIQFFWLLLTLTQPTIPLFPLLFETVSAFGTVGFSMGVTKELNEFGKILIAILMFIGRVGPLTFVFAITRKKEKSQAKYPKDRLLIG